MAGQEFRPRSFYSQAWARLFFLPARKSPNESEVIPVPYGAPWPWLGASSLYPSLSLYGPLAQDLLGGLSHILWGLTCDERIGAPLDVGTNRVVRVSLTLSSPEEGKSGSPN